MMGLTLTNEAIKTVFRLRRPRLPHNLRSGMPGFRLAVLSAACLLLCAVPALAGSPLLKIKDLKQRVAAGSPTTYADLLKLVFPEPAPGEKEAPPGPLVRQIDGSDDYEPQPLKAKLAKMDIEVLPLKAQGRQLLLLDFWVKADSEKGFSYHLLGLFQTAPAPKLLDLLELNHPMFQFGGFWSPKPRFQLAPGTEACMLLGDSLGASLSQIFYQLLGVRNDRLEKLLLVYTVSTTNGWETITTKPAFWTEQDVGRKFPKFVAELTLRIRPDPDCSMAKLDSEPQRRRPRNFTRTYRGVWRWDPAQQKYRQVSGNLDKLYKFYEEPLR